MIARLAGWYRKRTLDARSLSAILKLERIINTSINDPEIYLRALRHRSKLIESSFKEHESYEQLEFLGDAVLDLVVTEIIYNRFPTSNEGTMTQIRSKIVKGETLARFSEKLGLNELIEVGNRVKSQGIQSSSNVLADIFEAVIGALFRDQGYQTVFAFISKVIEDEMNIDQIAEVRDNYKSILLEYAQARKLPVPVYEVLQLSGPDHERVYEIQVSINDAIKGKGVAMSKKKAEQLAAQEALKNIRV